ncbi:TIGR01777 family protein [Rhodobacteraceae bacterium B1Z28]|uniref:TIGR01777 family protein n=1 Tax=Ruegeria haliotis TaxID=2747601 RepID=A0ABX2PM54_9RHOB|nr:TIGR01777 family oxidoreductase [Ruegeria haliotis]NVO54184.1 TIGR01777 family protein [Ruegeria haliotis]
MDNPLLWILISIQVFMGAFDTLVHHEGTERLAWRPSQKTELRLHSIRNFFYTVIFLCFAWLEPHGAFTIALTAILGLEVLITLWDFVEEDMTRTLPGSERINHTLLALNYGAILALAVPYLWVWSALPTALVPVSYGWWSVMATLSAVGVGLFSARDLLAANRSERLTTGNPATLVAQLEPRQRILVTGGTGFIGQRLVQALVAGGHYVTVITRDPRKADTLTHPVRIITSLRQIHSADRFDAIVNLAGEPVANGLWTAQKRARIIESRVETTKALDALVQRLDHKPACLINGSAVGWYGLRQDEKLTEASTPCPAFVHQICEAWEQSANKIAEQGVRVVILRIGLVLSAEGGMLARLLTPFEFCGGGILGNGQQWMPWIERDDLVRIIAFTLARHDITGPVNATAPEPVRNVDFTQALAQALNRPAFLRFPERLLARLLGDMGRETMLGGQCVLPTLLQRRGFVFAHPKLAPALRVITGARSCTSERKAQERRA